MITAQQQTDYQHNGYLVLPHFKTAPELAALRERAQAIVQAFDPSERSGIFTTTEQARQTDDYFMGSANTVRCFFEEEAFGADGQLKQDKSLSINKIGHALHDLDPVFEQFSRGPAQAELAADVGLPQAQVWQSMYIFKQPGIGGEVRWHQDATVENGCLWVEPGGHRGPLRERFVKRGEGAGMEVLDTTPWPDDTTAVPVEVKAGTLVVFHGLLPHYSAPNRSAVSRHAYTLHATDASSHYSPGNWLQRPDTFAARGFI